MRRALLVLLALVALAFLMSSACRGPASPGGHGECELGLCVHLALAEPIPFNQAVPVTVTVETETDVAGLGVSLYADDPHIAIAPQSYWQVDTHAGEPLVLTATVTFPEEGYCTLLARLKHPQGGGPVDYAWLRITPAGGTINPSLTIEPAPTLAYDPCCPPEPPQPGQIVAEGAPDLPIPDDGSGVTYTVPITRVPSSAVVGKVSVKVGVQHPRPQDLVLELIGPDGRTVQRLWDRQVPGPENLTEGYFLARLEALHGFDGLPVKGVWTLRLRDEAPGEAGRWLNYSLAVLWPPPASARPAVPMA